MSFSSGTFTLVAGNPVVTATTVSSTWANNTLSDIATGLSTCLLKDGTQSTTAVIPFDKGSTGDQATFGHTLKLYASENGTLAGMTTATANGGNGFTATSTTANLVIAGSNALSATSTTITTPNNFTAGSAVAIPAGGTSGQGLMYTSTANFGVFFGSSTPTLLAAKGSLYLRSDGSGTGDRAYINTNGSTAWTAITTAS